jgi:superfamily II DNA or RNA helicase
MTPRLAKRYERELLEKNQIDPRNEQTQQLIEQYAVDSLDDTLLDRIEGFVDEYNTHVGESYDLRYYQVLALYFTEHFFREQAGGEADPQDMLAYWMATGSGKTLVMHLNILQHLHRLEREGVDFDTLQILFTTPSKNLIGQHERELEPYVEALNRRYNDRIDLLIDTTQGLLQHDIEYFRIDDDTMQRLVLVDEGHIGLGATKEGEFKKLRDALNARNSFLFEYSATYHNIGSGAIEEEYERAIVYDYNYSRFYRDGYGKDYFFKRIGEDVIDDEKDNLDECFGVLQKKMDAYQALMDLDANQRNKYFPNNLPQRPLAAFMGRTVDPGSSATDETSDVGTVIRYLASLSAEERRTFGDVFHGDTTGPLVLARNPSVEDELLLSYGDGEKWGIVNVGDAAKFFRDFDTEDLDAVKREDAITDERYRFQNVDRRDSPINVLVGSRKFSEGWNCFRLSVTGLLNLGSSKGNQIIQIFGRGVRLHGARDDGKRLFPDHVDDYYTLGDDVEDEIRRLETLTVFSLRRSYLETFIEEIQKEVKPRTSFTIRVNPTIMKLGDEEVTFETYREHLPIFKSRKQEIGWVKVVLDDGTFRYEHLDGDDGETGEFERYRTRLDYRTDRETEGHNVRYKLHNEEDGRGLYHTLDSFLDHAGWARTIRDAADKAQLALYARDENGDLRPATLPDLIQLVESIQYKSPLNDAGIETIDALGHEIIRDVVGKLENKVHYDINRRHYVYDEPLAVSDQTTDRDIIYEYVVTKQFDEQEEKDAFERDLDAKKDEIEEALQIGPIDEHIYEPLLEEGEDGDGMQISPDALNAGERKFVDDLSRYVTTHFADSERYDFYLLRNVESLKSIGIFMESDEHTFYPDFVLWGLDHETGETDVAFVDPKGERGMVEASKLGANAKVNLSLKNEEYPALSRLETQLADAHDGDVTLHSFLLLRDSSEMGVAESDEWIESNMLSRNIFRLDWHEWDESGNPSQKWQGDSYLDLLFGELGLQETAPA